MDNKKNHFFKFKRKKIKYKKEDPIQDLIDLYAEEEQELNGVSIEAVDAKHESQINKLKDEYYLKELIDEKRQHRKKKIVIFSIIGLVLLAGSALAGFFYFSGNVRPATEAVSIAIEAPDKIQVGEEFAYIITYQNLGDADFLTSRITVQYPKGFIMMKAEPQNSNHKWELGTLAPGQKGKITITGKIVDTLESEQKLIAAITFQPDNFRSDFTKETSLSIALEAPQIDLANVFPANLTPGQKITLQTKLKNKSDRLFENIKLQYLYPEKFAFLNASPNAYEDSNQWIISELKGKEESKNISIEGSFPADLSFQNEAEREQPFTVQILLPGKDGQYLAVSETKFTIKIIDQALNTYLIVNGSTENKAVGLGDELTISAIAKNNGVSAYQNLKIKILITSLSSEIINWNKIKDDHFGKIQKLNETKEITWEAKQISELKSLAPGKDVSVNIILPLKSLAELTNIDLNSLNQSTIEISSQIILDEKNNSAIPPVKSSPVILVLNSNVNIGAKALYYYSDGTPVGTGPWPPHAGQTTKLKIFWDLSNDLHEIKDLTVSTALPQNINWINEKNVSTGEITFDEASRTIAWKINRLPALVKEAHANFSLAFTPQTNEIGTLLKLTGNCTLVARDVSTDELITRTKSILTTALELDSFATGNGTVQP
ncbi:MAG: hypothetical protein AAB575_03330 [Patescibacteria group bacterium]